MSAQITTLIPNQQFERIRDRIGLIVAEEFASQAAMSGSDVPDPEVWIERIVPMDIEEMPLINVSLGRGDYDNKNPRSADGTYTYYIDVYAKAKAERDGDGVITHADKLASIKVHRMLGVLRAIFSNPKYRTLSFAAPSLSRVWVRNITGAMTMADEKDSTRCMMARLELAVRVAETVDLPEGDTIASAVTQFVLEETDKGMRYSWGYTMELTIDEDGNSFTVPRQFAGKDVLSVHVGNQPYNSSSFSQAGDSYTMTNDLTFKKGDRITVALRDASFSASIVVAEDGTSFTLPSTLANKTIAVVITETAAHRLSAWTREGLVMNMHNEITFKAGDIVDVIFGNEVVDVLITEDGPNFTLPALPANYELALLVLTNEMYAPPTFIMNGLNGRMTNGATFVSSDTLTAILR